MEIKSINSKLKQSEIPGELKISSSTLQRYKREISMLSPYRIPPTSNTHKRKQRTEHDLKVTSNDFKMSSNEPAKQEEKNQKEVCQTIIPPKEVILLNTLFLVQ